MKSTSWLAPQGALIMRTFFSIALVVFWSACSDDSVRPAGPDGDAAAKKPLSVQSNTNTNTPNSNSESNLGDYNIQVSNDGPVWTYIITKNQGAKGLSHFIINLDNCDWSNALSVDSFVSATVNGVSWPLSSSEGNGTGCELTTDKFVKFDDLPDAQSYTIVFTLNQTFMNFHVSTVWLKAGTSCVPYEVIAPCCPV